MDKLMMQDFIVRFPLEGARLIKYWRYSTYELAVQLDDGSVLIYDFIIKGIRRAPSYAEQLTDDECKKEFGRRLQQLLYSKGMTQEDLAEAVGTSQTIISQYVSGRVNPSFSKVDKICRVLNCSMDELRYNANPDIN